MLYTIIWALVIGLSACVPVAKPSEHLMKQLVRNYQNNTIRHLTPQEDCTTRNLVRRKEWGDLSRRARLEYISAIKCMHQLPSKIDPAKAPGARSRYDDFEAAHIMNTVLVHGTGLFFAWHRWFVYLFETALRDECGYSGYQPYWDWARWAELPTSSNPLYDGSPTSLSGNGRYIPNRNGTNQPFPIPVDDPPVLYTPPGTGGGHIYDGPLVNWTLHLGPYFHQTVKNGIPVPANPQSDGLGYNPRHIIRDFNSSLLQDSNTYAGVTSLIVNQTNIHTFHPALFTGAHLAGHSFISGVDNDLFTSPGDPLFWFHHAQVDRVWSIWQAQNFTERENAIDGTLTVVNIPPSRNATLDDIMHYEFAPDLAIKYAMSPTKNHMCYMYD